MISKDNPRTADAAAADYAEAVLQFGKAVDLMQRGDLEQARQAFETVATVSADEPALAERARVYARVCGRRTAPAATDPTTPREMYAHGVVLANRGDLDEAIRLFDRAIQAEPTSAWHLYARASAYALRGNADAAIGDLRQAIALDPSCRFQAVNDPDFEQIREEPAFIDIIEPTTAGA